MRRFASITLLAAALLAPARAAHADEPQPWVGVTVEELYDSNVLNQLGPDAVTRVTPRGGFLWEGRRGHLIGEYLASLHAYARGTTDASVNHKAELRGRWEATRRLDLGASAALVVADDPILLDRAAVAITEGGVFDVSGKTDGSFRLTRRLSLIGGYDWRVSRFEDADDMVFVDGDEHHAKLGLGWRFSRRLEGTVNGRWQHFVSYLADGTKHDDAVGATAGLSWRLSRLWRVGFDAGPLWLSTDEEYLPLAGGARVVRTGQRTRFTISGSRELYGATGAIGAVFSDSARVDLAWLLQQRLAVRLRAGVYRSDSTLVDGTATGVVARGELGWMSRRGGFRLDLYAEHRAQNGEGAGGGFAFDDVQRTIVGIRIGALVGADFMEIEETR